MNTLLGAILVVASFIGFSAASPDPIASPAQVRVCEAQLRDVARNRIIPLRIRMPTGAGKVPLILFSHGLGGNLDAGTLWAEAWTADGNAVIHLQHAGSDSGIIGGGGLRRAMSIGQLRARALDVTFVIDEIGRHPHQGACDLTRIDLNRIGMSGHSFGAQTTLAVAGQVYPLADVKLADPRIKAGVALSPQQALAQPDHVAFGGITMPFLIITGTEDVLPWLTEVTSKDRERPFRAMAPGEKYLLVMQGGNHRMFGGQDNIPLPESTRVPHIRSVVARSTTLFWRATLRDDHAALAELDRFNTTLREGDRWERR
ncbi:dienelactone hydrolase [Sphingomonas sp. QA11]|uniref:alpha/beta hydrolase family protein n=1 Tax=Sphingomonas sp. QA11 TaxID=2950605 RepID=UPI00234A479C|nr:dienelactone hydrolase [Sphingomonas sp. QA11]WCM27408.1 dienelactone hydrolase [Sphingomonas sp. QA11]